MILAKNVKFRLGLMA